MKTIEVEVINRLGLHARPAAKLTQKANEFLSEIKIDKDGRVVNGKSDHGRHAFGCFQGHRFKNQCRRDG